MVLTAPIPFSFDHVKVEIVPSDEGGFVAHNDELQVAAIGGTADEAKASFIHGVQELIQLCIEQGLPLPAALSA